MGEYVERLEIVVRQEAQAQQRVVVALVVRRMRARALRQQQVMRRVVEMVQRMIRQYPKRKSIQCQVRRLILREKQLRHSQKIHNCKFPFCFVLVIVDFVVDTGTYQICKLRYFQDYN